MKKITSLWKEKVLQIVQLGPVRGEYIIKEKEKQHKWLNKDKENQNRAMMERYSKINMILIQVQRKPDSGKRKAPNFTKLNPRADPWLKY